MKRKSMVAMGAALMVAASALSVAPAQALSMGTGGGSCTVDYYTPARGIGVDSISCTKAQGRISYFTPTGSLVYSTTPWSANYVQTEISADLRLGGHRQVKAALGSFESAWTTV